MFEEYFTRSQSICANKRTNPRWYIPNRDDRVAKSEGDSVIHCGAPIAPSYAYIRPRHIQNKGPPA